GEVSPAVYRALERVADSAGQAGKDEGLNLPLAVTDRNRPGFEVLDRDIVSDLGSARIDRRRVNADLLRDRLQLEFDVHRERLPDAQRDGFSRRRAKPGGGDP